jgi:hypothetical protein
MTISSEATDHEIIERTIGDLLPPLHTLRTQIQRYVHGDLKHLTWEEFEAMLRRIEESHG